MSLAGLGVEVLRSYYHWKYREDDIVALLSLSEEQNLPTFYSAVLLLFASLASALLAGASRAKRWEAVAWWGLCAGFFYIAVDEVLQFHETWGANIHTTGVLHFSWVIPAAGLLAVLAVLYAPFLLRMPARERNWLILAGVVYVTGAVGLELPLGVWTEEKGDKTLGYALIDWVEETLEMTGIVLYLFVTFDMLARRGVTIRFGAPKVEEPALSQGQDPSEGGPT